MQATLETIRQWVFQNWVILAAGAGLVIYGYIRSLMQNKEWQEKAQASNLRFLGKSLPDDLSLDGTNLSGSNFTVNNSVAGVVQGIHLAAFEVKESGDESSIRQTVVAFQMDSKLQTGTPPKEPSGTYHFEICGRWLLAWIPTRTIEPNELEDWSSELYDLAARLISEQGSNSQGGSELAGRLFREF